MSPPQLSWPPLTWPLCLYFHLYLFFHKHGITVRSLSCLASWTQHNVSEINLLWVAVVHSFWLEEGIQTARSHMKRCSRSLVLKEMQSKTTRRHSYRLSEQPQRLTIPGVGADREKPELLHITRSGSTNWSITWTAVGLSNSHSPLLWPG